MSPLDKTVLVVEDNDLNMKLFHDGRRYRIERSLE